MQLDELVQVHTCPICLDFPRPYLSVRNCISMHMVCGPCYAQLPTSRKNKCPTCNQAFKKYAFILGYHRPLEIAQHQYSYECMNKMLGCQKRLNHFNVCEHDKFCIFAPYRCSKPNCSFICPFAELLNFPHHHLKLVASGNTSMWSFPILLKKFYSLMLDRILIDSTVPKFALLKGNLESFDYLFRPIVSFYLAPSGKAVTTKLTWHCKKVFSPIKLNEFKFLVTFYVSTHAGYLRRSFITRAQYISFTSSTRNEIGQEFFLMLFRAFRISSCVECSLAKPHFHVKIILIDFPQMYDQND